ncbi:hypothetical protein [Saccharolobus caldissimus]|uniref:Uncharacterized protein n=1 Tax=Saccharolobus caldissimus TaxID=1702097 RepID=A0AAQ4CMF8_9CREN|nr:hypothetical protein [Saccharolobus caldissimus]BDB96989.1 hypothetical protein SACC_00060 [Saccharolobus caldissimus]
MSVQTQIPVNSPVNGDKDPIFSSLELITQSLSKNSRKILAEEFAETIERLGYTQQYVNMMINDKRTMGNDLLKRLLTNDPNALDRAIELLRKQIKQLEEAMRTIQSADLSQLRQMYPPKTSEDEEE